MTVKRVVPNIQSAQFEQSREFYRDFLGFNIAMDMGWIVTFSSPDNPAAQVTVLADPGPGGVHPNLSIEVADVDAVHAHAVARQLQIVYPLTDEPWGVRRFYVVDPNGVVINVMSHHK